MYKCSKTLRRAVAERHVSMDEKWMRNGERARDVFLRVDRGGMVRTAGRGGEQHEKTCRHERHTRAQGGIRNVGVSNDGPKVFVYIATM